jgi:5-methylcytosine-specific restriction endonuclease McrA
MKCEYCGIEFTGRKKKYCSRECCYNADVDNKRMKYVWISDRAEKCLLCGGKLGKGRYKFCSDECERKHYHICTGRISHSEILKKECVICGKAFETWKNRQVCCSEDCRKIYKNSHRDKRLDGIVIDKDISIQKLAERDNNRCQICGEPVDWNDKHENGQVIVCGNLYPSIDHVVPVSLGGLHSWDNVQLAHRVCNSKKNNKVVS